MTALSGGRRSVIPAAIFAVAVFLFVLTFSIALPIYIRPFYYVHIDALNLPKVSGFTAEEIRFAYDQVLDYLTLPGREFGTGVMACSQAAQDHFRDCRFLFDLNATVLIGSAGCILVLWILRITGHIAPLRLGKRSAGFWGAVIMLTAVTVIAALAVMDFRSAFVVFHSIFFPGKDDWVFSWYQDQIIRVLPMEFFMNCAILIGTGLLGQCVVILVAEFCRGKHKEATL